MTETTPDPKPRKSRRMVVWMVAVPIVILLLALAGANWKRFHLAYAKHLMGSDERQSREEGVRMIVKTHLRGGMSREEVRGLFHPIKLEPAGTVGGVCKVVIWEDESGRLTYRLFFDDEGRLFEKPGGVARALWQYGDGATPKKPPPDK